ncbi:hypothetical protein D9757_012524 [Collybiopsis confluens]|uniref:Uncharacterized protein n=1 Tax=Collybiopsis confluens TaxID=2823264 RepID=A0A8H5G1S2_9AGAR|nr:hypothetical protein D9757_012524 [Collybiopsis confluens]
MSLQAKRGKSILSLKSRLGGVSLRSSYKTPENLDEHDFTVHMPSHTVFERIDVDIDAEYRINLRLNSDVGMLQGYIDDKPFAQGGMKIVFKLRISDTVYAAKRFAKFDDNDSFNDSINEDKLQKNYKLLSLDAGRLEQCRGFLKEFYEHAANKGVDKIHEPTPQLYSRSC